MNYSLRGRGWVVGFVLYLVAAKLVHQHMFSSPYLIFDKKIINIKKDMRGLVHEKLKKWSNISQVRHFYSGFDHKYLAMTVSRH